MRGKTVIVVAHRLSTIARMDRILVFDDGRIIEDGSHTELLAQGGAYYRLWSRQAGGFLPEAIGGESAGKTGGLLTLSAHEDGLLIVDKDTQEDDVEPDAPSPLV
jgi:energy-coupling factor transporter ATP-binding protein EcfA2